MSKLIEIKNVAYFLSFYIDLPKHSIVSMIEAISWTSITPSLSTSNNLKIHSSLFCSVVQVAISRANKNSLKSKNPFPSESKILKICLLNLYPSPKRRTGSLNCGYVPSVNKCCYQRWEKLPSGNAFLNKSINCAIVSLPLGQSILNLLNQSIIWSSVKLVFSMQKSMSSDFKYDPVYLVNKIWLWFMFWSLNLKIYF